MSAGGGKKQLQQDPAEADDEPNTPAHNYDRIEINTLALCNYMDMARTNTHIQAAQLFLVY